MLGSVYDIDVEGKNVEVISPDTVRLKDAQKMYSDGKIPDSVFESLDEDSQQIIFDSWGSELEFIPDTDVVSNSKGEDEDAVQDRPRSDAVGSDRQKDLEENVGERSDGTSEGNDPRRSDGETSSTGFGIFGQIHDASRRIGDRLDDSLKSILKTLHLTIPKGVDVDVDKFDKLIEDSFGDLTPRLQSLLENILSDMNTVVLYFGDSAKDSPLGNNYFGYNVVRVFEDALSGEGEKTILHEILHSFHGAIELGAGDKAYAINYITHDFLVNKNSELIKPEIRKVVNTLISQLKDNQVESGLTSEWNNLIYYHANEKPEVVDYVCRMIAEDPQAVKALSENPELKQELLVAKTIAQLRLTHDIPTLRAKSRDVENRILEMGRLAKKGVPKLNQKRESFLKQLGISIPFRNGKLTDKAALALKEYFDKDKNINAPKQISIKSIIKKNLDRMKVASHEETAQRSALYAAGVIPGKDKANILRRMFEDPLHFFKKYLPDGLHIYRLADEARRNMEKFVTNYSKRFSDTFDGISKKNRDRLCQLILKADELHRDPMQVIKLDNGLYIAARHDAFIEHYDEYATAMTRAKELRDSGKYRIVKTMQETEENENAGFGKGYTVFAIPKGSAVFRSEKAAQEFCNKGEREAYESLIRSISGKDVTKEDIKAITDSYKKYRSMMDDIYTDMVTAAKESGAKYSIPKKLHGYFPHLHLPYVVWVQNQDGTYTKTSSFYNGSEASKEVKRLADKGVKAYWAEMNPINAINLQERMGKVDRMTEEQLLELDKEGSIQLNDSVSAVGDYNHALKKMVAPLFKKNEKVSVGEVMKFLEKEQRRYEKHKNTGVKEIDGFRKAALSQLKVTKLFKQLQRMKQKDMITQAELENLINSSNMNKKFNAHFQKRESASGYSKNVLDSVYRYMVTAGNFTSKAKFYAEGSAYYAQKFKKDIREEAVTDTEKFLKMYIKANHSPTSVTALDNMINDYLNLLVEKDPTGFGAMLKNHYGRGIYTGLARDTLSLQNLLKLGLFRPASLAVQAFQVLNANAKLGGNKVIGLSKYFRTGLKEAVGSKYDSKWKELYDYIGINEESVALDSELLGRSPKFTEKALVRGKSLKDFANASMIFFNAGDRWARKATAIGGYLKAVDDFKSLSKDEKKEMLDKAISSWERRKERAELNHISFKDPKPTMESVRKEYIFNSAKDLVTETNFNYSTTDTPLAMTEAGVTGKLLLQFKKYPLFTLNFMLHNSKEENIRFLVPMLIMAGCLGMPCAGLVDDIFDKTTGNSPSLVLKRHMIEWAGGSATKRALVNVALYGAPSMAGINLSQNIGLGDAIQFDLGPTVSTVTNIMGGNGVIRSLAPYLGALSDAASGEKEDRYGNLTVKYSPYDQLLKAFGFKPVTETNSMDASKVLRQAKDAYRDSLSKAKKEYIKNPNADNYQALLIYGLKDSDIAKLLKTKDTTQIEQLSKSIPKNPKNQGAREVQELAKAAQNFTK